ncbi:hypothetical protein NDU88_005354 [Pleurodeles waltl]|uniref:Uncharacterized protein n=1 Tax=Pleurodeles waltl TaxID=8319 RepID=A0AAV7TTQ8_PLEWA|nr:hypothetical protein NDU88_005354 [Pleurodeles waltl]
MLTEDKRAKNSFSPASRRTAHTSFTSLRVERGGRMREHKHEKRTCPLRTRRGLGVGATPKLKREYAHWQMPSLLSRRNRQRK